MTKLRLFLLCFVFYFASCVFTACNNTATNQEADCPKGAPTAVYSSDLDFVKSHGFESTGQKSEEKVIFENNSELTIRQSGCERISQSYSFRINEDLTTKADSFWIQRSIDEFLQLSRFGEKFYAFQLWANKIAEHKSDFKLTEPFQVSDGIYIKIDRIIDDQEAILQIDLFEQ